MWTSSNNYAFLAIVAHYVNKNGNLGIFKSFFFFVHMLILPVLEELLIDFCELVGEHSGENMTEVVWETLD